MEKDYFLGLDLGTGSLGWAVTDENYEIIRRHGKALWGVRLFESAKTAQERRTFRINRRRIDRRNWRIELLQGIFSGEINKIDPGFYLRMKESRYVPEDKQDMNGKSPILPYALFVDQNFTDKEFHKNFPTIYHLRQWLMHTDETPEIRLVYLAFHHMMKHRGHFLLSESIIDNITEFDSTFQQFIKCVENEELDFELKPVEKDIKAVEEILKNRKLTKTAKKAQLIKTLNAKSTCEKALLNLIAGGTEKLSSLLGNSEFDNLEKTKISFSDSNYDDYIDIVKNDVGEQFIIIEKAKTVYDWSILVDILGGHKSISDSKVAIYEKHKSDLAYLKKLVKENLSPQVYKDIFIKTDEKVNNYSAYIGMTKLNGKKTPIIGKQCSKRDFYNYLKKQVLSVLENLPEADYLKSEIDRETFLPKQVTKDNGVIPYQIHLYELEQIIQNLQERIPLLKEQGDKIRQIFRFRIPYYVGPLNGITKSGQTTNWMIRNANKENVKIYPWNFQEVVNIEESAEQFIRRMINKCTYLVHEDVLPKNSLLYSKFMVLNELNNLRLNGEPITIQLKQSIYEELLKKRRKITQKKLKDYLVQTGIIAKEDIANLDISGIDGDFKASLTAYHDFKEKLTDCKLKQEEKENIILNITLFGEDKKLLKKRLTALYPQLTENQIKGLITLNYCGWGRLSKAFLERITAPAPETGEAWSIIRTMWETNDNLMQVLSDKYLFSEVIEQENGKDEIKDISYDLVEQLYVSPAVKRQIWQTLQIVKEICKVMEMPPKRIFIEMAREKAENKRTESRRNALLDLYRNCKSEERDWVNELTNTEAASLRSDRLYLYYTQKGRCMYSGEVIELSELWNNNKYDIDHIYPQSKVMDDSLDNRVLVKKIYNAEKTDAYPIKSEIRNSRKSFWKSLLDGGFISKEKYNRLTRSKGFEPYELAGFIERQLVETRQGTKAAASILKQILPDTEIVYVKAKIVSQFRQEFKLIKVREMNDLHHAKDAYLNVVVGNVYFTKFTKNAVWFIKSNPERSYNLKRMFTSKDVISNGETAWKAGDNGTIITVKKIMAKNNILVTRRAYEAKGGLFKQQLLKKGKGQVPVKGSDERLKSIEKYGGYDKAKGTYFMLVESEDKKGNKMRTIEFVPLYLCEKISVSEKAMLDYLESGSKLKDPLKNPQILLPKIKIDSLFKVDGFYMWLSGRTGKQLIFKGANQLVLTAKDTATLKKVMKFVTRRKENKKLEIVPHDELTTTDLLDLYDVFLDKLSNKVYKVRLSAQAITLTKRRDEFCALNNEDKCIVLSEILHMFQCQSGGADLTLIHGPGKAGEILISNNIGKFNQFLIINQSPTGIYGQEIDLKKL